VHTVAAKKIWSTVKFCANINAESLVRQCLD